jgi:NADH:ubiquinone oxidoreductase subunit F (NADH-binding)
MTTTIGETVRGTVSAPGVLAAGATTLAEHVKRNGGLPTGVDVIAEVKVAGLTGRGGAGFPTWRKLTAVRDAGAVKRGPLSGGRPVVVANAAEGEPASGKDAVLLEHAPHLILDGLALAAAAVGATEAWVQVKPGRGAVAIGRAIAERRSAKWDAIGPKVNIADSSFLAGEESAVVSALSGRPAVPYDKRVMVVEAGVKGRPTLVQNAETLAQLALIARHGSDWFRGYGTADEPGTILSTVSGAVVRPGVIEVPHGLRLDHLLGMAGGPRGLLSALLVGGYHGAWVPASAAGLATPMSRAGLKQWGATPGAGVVMALGRGECGVAATARIVRYLAGESAGQCGPCLNGLPAIAGALEALADLDRRVDRSRLAAQVSWLTRLVDGRGACAHPDGTARLVRSTLRTFGRDVSAHASGWCVEAAVGREWGGSPGSGAGAGYGSGGTR